MDVQDFLDVVVVVHGGLIMDSIYYLDDDERSVVQIDVFVANGVIVSYDLA